MLTISAKEFESNPGTYLDKVEEGIEIVIKKGRKQFCRIIPAREDDTLLTREEFLARVDESIRQHEEGKTRKLTPEYRKRLFES